MSSVNSFKKGATMKHLSEMSIKLDLSEFDRANNLLKNMYNSIVEYNKEVAKSNRLLEKQEGLRKKLKVYVKNGKTEGLVKEEDNG